MKEKGGNNNKRIKGDVRAESSGQGLKEREKRGERIVIETEVCPFFFFREK